MSEGVAASVDVHVLKPHEELLIIVRAGVAICILVWMYIAVSAGVGGAKREQNLLPFQKIIAERDPAEQRMFRELQEGIIEAERARDETGAWPTPDALAENGVPPFAPDPTRKLKYDWALNRTNLAASYLGRPHGTDAPAWMVLLQDPIPGVPPDQTFEDEEHHRLADGMMLHVSTWVHGRGQGIPARLTLMPQAEGWTQLYAVGPATRPGAAVTAPN
jgi:hypothetical protein